MLIARNIEQINYATTPVSNVWHLSHARNLHSIFISAAGILSKNEINQQRVAFNDISMPQPQSRRANKSVFNIPLHSYVPTCFCQRNPMMYYLKNRANELVWLKVNTLLIDPNHCVTADRNAAANGVQFFSGIAPEHLNWSVLNAEFWHNFTDGSAYRGAELLIKNRVPVSAICGAEVANKRLLGWLESEFGLNAEHNPDAFFAYN